ncbi:hypothetical protein [Taibaiella koreensis]|uniref:hypothetical protein n=1 Tax=Taibaiella koreensis TaxID=1268548 RepID=UPI000E59C861|nr:hypothetical protein [Taibaiella koreensis]
MTKDQQKNEDNQLHKDKVDRRTTHLDNEEIERMPDSGDDYRLPRDLPEPVEEPESYREGLPEIQEEDEDGELIDDDTDISPDEIALLEESERDTSSDESRASDLLDDTDEDGDELNEGPDEDNAFDLGEDLDMPNDVNNPDIDEEDERF